MGKPASTLFALSFSLIIDAIDLAGAIGPGTASRTFGARPSGPSRGRE